MAMKRVDGTGRFAAGAPATGSIATGAPATGAPATGAPATGAPATGAPATGAPATGAPATGAPATGAPATGAPATEGDPKRGAVTKQIEEKTELADKPGGVSRKAPRPAFCRVYARARVAEAIPDLVATLLREAGDGSLPHLKVLLQLSGLDTGEVVPQGGRRKGKSLEAVLKERWESDRKEREDTERDGQRGNATARGSEEELAGDRRMNEV